MVPKGLVIGISIVFMLSILVFMVELFVPLSAKSELDVIGRKALLQMENNNGLSELDIAAYTNELRNLGFESVKITSTQNASKGEEVDLKIEASYKYSRLVSLFSRADINQIMRYDKTAIARKVVN